MKSKRLVPRITVLIIIALVLAAGCAPLVAPKQTPTAVPAGVWTKKADLPTPRWEHATCVMDGKVYVIGGAGPVFEALGTVEVYDPVTNTWTTKSPMPTARQGLSASMVNGKIYAIGGGKAISRQYAYIETFSAVEEYDPTTDTWTTKSPLPTERGWHSASVVDGKIYIIGGSQDTGPNLNQILTVEVYDPATDTWSQKGDMPEGRAAGSGSVVDGKIYLFGGYGGAHRVDEYDPATDTWTAKSNLPAIRIGHSTSVLDGKVFLIGGFSLGVTGFGGMTTVYVYDPATDTWTTAPDMPTARSVAYAGVVDGKIYIFGGLENYTFGGGDPYEALGVVEEYDPKGD